MSLLLEDMLTMGKSDAGKILPTVGAVELKSFLQVIIEDVQNNSNNTHRVKLNFDGDSLTIQSDEKLLRNIFLNLLNNAIKFSPEQPEVLLTVDVVGPVVEIEISDKGIGIPKQDIERIFEPFNRGVNAGYIKGTGLGLSIVKKAVEILGGKLWMESKEGEGTKVTIKLKI